jgi:ABC-type transport system involved in cytochrome bd biosynthesis fused ATPase/permease subunit
LTCSIPITPIASIAFEQDRFCWLKGDLAFETLRQAVVEPGERVWIGAQTTSYAIPALTIQKAAFGAAPWMKNSAVELNAGLVAIIGARGSGKTALADIIAMGADAKDAGMGEASFLNGLVPS